MNKILTIAATAALLSTFTGSVSAQVVTFSGTVPSSCTVSTPLTGTLTPNTAPATSMAGTVTATVICNDTAKSLTIAVGAAAGNTLFNGTGSTTLSGGTGALSGATGTAKLTTATTPVAGDTAIINALVSAPASGLLAKGDYVLVIDATITP